jgi:hypothetical protein
MAWPGSTTGRYAPERALRYDRHRARNATQWYGEPFGANHQRAITINAVSTKSGAVQLQLHAEPIDVPLIPIGLRWSKGRIV